MWLDERKDHCGYELGWQMLIQRKEERATGMNNNGTYSAPI